MSESQEPVLPSAGQAPTPHTAKRRGAAKTAFGLLLILIAGIGGFSVYVYQQQQQSAQEMAALRQELTQLRDEQSPLLQNQQDVQTVKTTLTSLSGQQLKLDERQRELEQKMLSREQLRPNDWMLAEAGYLIRMAGRKLWLEQDLTTAAILLTDADTRIQAIGDPSLVPLRKALTEDIAAVKSAPVLDQEGLTLRVGTLLDNLDQLKIKGLEPTLEQDPAGDEVSDQISDWQTNLKKSAKQFAESFITIRRHDGQIEALLSPEQSAYLQENLRLQLQLAQLNLLRQDQANFRNHLHKAQAWLTDYYEADDSATSFMQKELAALQEVDITAHYPKTFAVQPLLEKALADRAQPAVR